MRWFPATPTLQAGLVCFLLLQTAGGQLSSFKNLFEKPLDTINGEVKERGIGGLLSAPIDGAKEATGSMIGKATSAFDPFAKMQQGLTEMKVDTFIDNIKSRSTTEPSMQLFGARQLEDSPRSSGGPISDSSVGGTTKGPRLSLFGQISDNNSLFGRPTTPEPPRPQPMDPIQTVQKNIQDMTIDAMLTNAKALLEDMCRATIEYLDKLKKAKTA